MSEYIVTCDEETASWIGNDVESMKPVVRCRDCRSFRIGTNTDSCGFTDKYAHPNGFCSWGKRR